MQVVTGLSLKNLKPAVWDPSSPYFIPALNAVMVSYADFHAMPARRRQAMEQGIRSHLGVPDAVKVYLDDGAFYFLTHGGETPRGAYEEFIAEARPDWRPIPQDFIPSPSMTRGQQQTCFERTMAMNHDYQHDGFVPVIHISPYLGRYLTAIQASTRLSQKPAIALGGIVPNLLRAPKALPYAQILASVRQVREQLSDKELHVFGMGGTATLHLARLLDINSVDSSGWRNRAARGIIQLPGGGDRTIADLGSWRGRKPSPDEWQRLAACRCSACRSFGLTGLRAKGVDGFANRATHNLWILLQEAQLIEHHLADGTYTEWYGEHLDNTTYRPLINLAVMMRAERL